MAKGRKTGGRVAGTPNKTTTDTALVCRALVEDTSYRREFSKRLYAGQLPAPLEAMVWHYAYGKPPEHMTHSGAIDLRPAQVIFELHDRARS